MKSKIFKQWYSRADCSAPTQSHWLSCRIQKLLQKAFYAGYKAALKQK